MPQIFSGGLSENMTHSVEDTLKTIECATAALVKYLELFAKLIEVKKIEEQLIKEHVRPRYASSSLAEYLVSELPLHQDLYFPEIYSFHDPDLDCSEDSDRKVDNDNIKGGGVLLHLKIYGLESIYHLRSRLEQNHESLKPLKVMEKIWECRDWTLLSSFTMNQLTTITLILNHDCDLKECIPALLHHCPDLNHLKLGDFMLDLINETLEAMAKLNYLCTLDLFYFHMCGDGACILLSMFKNYKSNSIFKSFVLDRCPGMSKGLIIGATDVPSLETLGFFGSHGYTGSREDINEISQYISKSFHIKNLSIGSMMFTDEAAQNLIKNRNLRHIDFYKVKGLPFTAESRSRKHFPHFRVNNHSYM
ncbi:hypothetical protein BDA99DRAFT_560681 [Phascolomyces articulosus]|uniref:Uncharacterized protein n=1 Tax=Phascolomyces articulosus TaxID=60185 RepID=A0AAD5JYD3_9FUNG|nr:hypothetical protein BDA99DRAFT_560681 [Phascolomyces articulosus]